MSTPKLKIDLYQYCLTNIETRLTTIDAKLASIAEARDNETKSSVGDKYETGRAMMQMEEEKSRRQLYEAQQAKLVLDGIKVEQFPDRIGLGSLVRTNRGIYFLAIGLGKVVLEGQTYYCISVQSPIGERLVNRTAGEQVEFNGQRIRIESID